MAGTDPLGSVGASELDSSMVQREVRRFLAEDVGAEDVTTRWTVPSDARTNAALVAREPCVVAGLDIAAAVFSELDPELRMQPSVCDGARISESRARGDDFRTGLADSHG